MQTIGGPGFVPIYYFDGYIDQLTILFNRAKSAEEILADATLVAHYSMDCLAYSALDSGPNRIDGTSVGLTAGQGGRVGQSLLFNSNSSYFQVTGLVLLGQSYRPFSFALWLRPIAQGGTILHVSELTNGTGWCSQFMGLSSSGQIIVRVPGMTGNIEIIGPVVTMDEWMHIVMTYSRANGLTLFINGRIYGQSEPFIYGTNSSSVPMVVTLGQSLDGNSCNLGSIQSGFYRGEIDEFYIYSRKLSYTDITALANP